MEIERFVWFGKDQTVTLSAGTTGGPPHGIWKRNDVVIESDDDDFTITFELDQSEEDFLVRVPYTSRLTSHGPTSGIFTYEVTNRLTPVLLFKSIIIDGMCLGSDGSIIIGRKNWKMNACMWVESVEGEILLQSFLRYLLSFTFIHTVV